MKLWALCQDSESSKEAAELQNLIALADGVALKIGVSEHQRYFDIFRSYAEMTADCGDEEVVASSLWVWR